MKKLYIPDGYPFDPPVPCPHHSGKHHTGCKLCKRYNVAHERRARWMAAHGIDNPGRLVDAGPTREHLRRLRDSRMSWSQIAQQAGMASHWIQNIIQPGGSERVQWVTEQAVLSVPIQRRCPAGHVPAAGVVRRTQALAAIGHSLSDQSRWYGVTNQAVWQLANLPRAHCREWMALRVNAAYDKWSMTDGTGPGAKRSRTLSRRAGWAPPLAWDEDSIDDPDARPAGVRQAAGQQPASEYDPQVVWRILHWQPPGRRPSQRERREAVEAMLAVGRPHWEIAAALCTGLPAMRRYIARLNKQRKKDVA